jgi:hypothetical protein
MNFTQEQRDQFNKLIDYRDEITNSMFHIERILKHYFPEEFEIAYQHYIPQIMTALYEDSKWLPRGNYNLQQTIDRLLEKMANNQDSSSIKRFI